MKNLETDSALELQAVRTALLREEALPLGMSARLEAAVARAAHAHKPPWTARIVVAAVAFVVTGFAAGDRLNGLSLLIVGCALVLYVWAAAAVIRGGEQTMVEPSRLP